jgi:hypothetical protein
MFTSTALTWGFTWQVQGSNLRRLSRRFYRGHPHAGPNDDLPAAMPPRDLPRSMSNHSSTANSRNQPIRTGCHRKPRTVATRRVRAGRDWTGRPASDRRLLEHAQYFRAAVANDAKHGVPQPSLSEGKPTRTAGSPSDRGPGRRGSRRLSDLDRQPGRPRVPSGLGDRHAGAGGAPSPNWRASPVKGHQKLPGGGH